MPRPLITSSKKRFFISIIVFLVATNLAVLLDIPFLRQFFGFILVTFIPGILIIYILYPSGLNKIPLSEKAALSVGLSIAFAMFFGLSANTLLFALGYTKPLSTICLLILFSIATIALSIAASVRNKSFALSLSYLRLTTGEKVFLVLPALFPLLSVLGMRIMNLSDNNLILMALLFLISVYLIFVSIFHRRIPAKVYPVAIFLIGISLLLMFSLRSNHILGTDTHSEYYLFRETMNNLHWVTVKGGPLGSCLSISLLPSIYQSLLNVNPEYLFKILYSIIVSFLPLVVYAVARRYVSGFYAFLSSIFLISQSMFLWTPAEIRENVGVLFFALAIMVLFHDGVSEFAKRILFIIFTVAVIVSHYTTAYLVFFVLLFTYIGMQVLHRIILFYQKEPVSVLPETGAEQKTPVSSPEGFLTGSHTVASKAIDREHSQVRLQRLIPATTVILFFSTLFLWIGQLTESPFNIAAGFLYNTLINLNKFFLIESRSPHIQAALGQVTLEIGIAQEIKFYVSWMTIAFIAIGILTLIIRFKKMTSISSSKNEKPSFLVNKIEAEYFVLLISCCVILVLGVALPYISKGYGFTRSYFQMVVPLSICFVIGGVTIARYIKLRLQSHWVILLALIPYFMCMTGTVYQITGVPYTIILNSEGDMYNTYYIHDQESHAARYLEDHGASLAVYSDRYGTRRLLSQGQINSQVIYTSPELEYPKRKEIEGYIYLGYYNVVDSKLVFDDVYDISEFPDIFTGKNLIYANGGSEIWK